MRSMQLVPSCCCNGFVLGVKGVVPAPYILLLRRGDFSLRSEWRWRWRSSHSPSSLND